jgi:uncharacterized radical SAM superfamily protein
MVTAREPEELEKIAERLSREGGSGFLLSGGSTSSGKVPLARFGDAIESIKRSTALRVNAHVGLMPRDELSVLVAAGVDAFSVDIYGSDNAISGTLGLDATAEDYMTVVSDLIDLGAPLVVPHICVGIEEGRLVGEFEAIDMLAGVRPEALVMIVLAPTKGTPYAALEPPNDVDVLSVIRHAVERLPSARVNLGCMRPRGKRALEVEAAYAGVSGLAVPSSATKEKLSRDGWHVVEKETCCAFG